MGINVRLTKTISTILSASAKAPAGQVRLTGVAILLFVAASAALFTRVEAVQALNPADLVAELDSPETQWRASAQLQAFREAALPMLLESERLARPRDHFTAHMLALAKFGVPAIPLITQRVIALLDARDDTAASARYRLIEVLGAMGPAAVRALLQIAELSTNSGITRQALDEIVGLEPRTRAYGQILSPWMFWRPADTLLDELRRELVPQLPRVRKLMDRERIQWKPQYPAPHRTAAYLLARWGEGDTRARGLRALEELARNDEPFHYNLDSIRLLHALGAPATPALIRRAALRIPDTDELKGQYLLGLAIALHQLGDLDYGPLLAEALRDPGHYARTEIARFIGSSAEIAHVALLVPLLEDHSVRDGRTVAQMTAESIQHLPLEALGTDPRLWRAWLEANRGVSRSALVARRVKAHVAVIGQVPIWEANRWMEEFAGSDGAALFPLIDRYLARRDLNASSRGPNSFGGGGGTGPIGMYGPRVVTLLLDMTSRGVPGARGRLDACLNAADPQVRMFGALAVAAYDKPRAIERLALEAKSPEAWHRNRASEFLLQLGDKRGIPARLESLGSDFEPTRKSACRDVRTYTQEALPCESAASESERAANIKAWRAWWQQAEPTFSVKTRQAELDLQFPLIAPVSWGNRPVK